MRLLLAVLLALVFAPPAAAAEAVARVQVMRDGNVWTADYDLSGKAPVWVFAKSILPRESKQSWRIRSVEVLTPGVRLQRLGNFDSLVAYGGPVPRKVKLRFTPFVEDIEAGYDAALAFADGSVAIYAGQFELVPMPSVEAVRAASPDDAKLPGGPHRTVMTFADRSGPVLVRGRREARPQLDRGDTYVLFGPAEPAIGPAMTTVLDGGLPSWIAAYLNAELPRILKQYQDRLGPSPVGQPTLLASWAGPEKGQVSFSGSVLPGMVVMTLKGDGIVTPNDKVSRYARWFVAHEAAHFWLGQSVHYSNPSESWITEGGADLLAFRATAATDPDYDVKARLSQAKAECAPFLANGGVAGAFEREGDFRAYYACGAIIALAAEKASGGDFSNFVRTLIQRSAEDRTVTRAEWLALLDERAKDVRLSAAVAKLLDERQSDPARALDEFIAIAGIADQFATAKPKP